MDSPLPATWKTDEAAVRAAQAGIRPAFDALAARYRGLVVSLAYQRTGSREDAEDLAQQALAQAWRSLPALQESGRFQAWLCAITANICRDWHRKTHLATEALQDDVLTGDPAALPVEALLARERQHTVQRALRALPELNCRALLLHVVGGYSYADIAQLLAIPLTTVEGRIYRARQQLRRLLVTDETLTGATRRRYHALEEIR